MPRASNQKLKPLYLAKILLERTDEHNALTAQELAAALKLLVDAVQSSRFITGKKSEELIGKLSKLASSQQAKELKRQVYVAGRAKTPNKMVYYSIDLPQTRPRPVRPVPG